VAAFAAALLGGATELKEKREEEEGRKEEMDVLEIVRNRYFLSAKPEIGLDESRKNVVVHIRRGDSEGRIGDNTVQEDYFSRAISLFNSSFPSNPLSTISISPDDLKNTTEEWNAQLPLFWIETDDVEWVFLKKLKEKFGDQIRLPTDKTTNADEQDASPVNFLVSFHRLVMADGLIISSSSFSHAAVFLNQKSNKVAKPKARNDILRQIWFDESEKFVLIRR
jgi:hypothetical protein